MTPFLTAFNFVRQSKAAQIILTLGIILLIWFANNAYQRSVGSARQKIKAREDEIEVIEEIRDNGDDIIKRAQAARAAAIAAEYPDADSVPDKLAAVLFDD